MVESLAVGWTTTARGIIFDERTLARERGAQRQAIMNAVRRIVQPDCPVLA